MIQVQEIQKNSSGSVLYDSWGSLKVFTAARIALGRTGTSVPLNEYLSFKLAHANARDAVFSSIEMQQLDEELQLLRLPVQHVKSKTRNRKEYLQRPDLGRQLDQKSVAQLKELSAPGFDVAIVIGDGLSAAAINAHVIKLLELLVVKLTGAGCTIAPAVVVKNARVAIADEIGELLNAKITLMLIGERPGLSSTDSLGAYLTYAPKVGLTDESRNCVSNIRPEGLSYSTASEKIFYLVSESLKRKLSGVELKEELLPNSYLCREING